MSSTNAPLPETALDLQACSVAIVGHTGFVGGTLRDHLPRAACYNSANIDAIAGTRHDAILCAGLPAAKWWINQHPDEDAANMRVLQGALETAECGTFVLVSTIDVYDTAAVNQDEDNVTLAAHAYGRHRHAMERWCTARYGARCVILRLPGLFGVGLKKNVIFDMIHGRADQLATMSPASAFQWFDMGEVYGCVAAACARGEGGVVNVFTEPVTMTELAAAAFPEYADVIACNTSATAVRYDVKTVRTPTGYVQCKADVIRRVVAFAAMQRKLVQGRGALLAVSNLAWAPADDAHALRVLAKYGIGNVEIAPTRYGAWDAVDPGAIKRAVEGAGLVPYSFQAIFYGCPANLFDDDGGVAFVDHFKHVLRLAAATGVKRIVFGSPKNRAVRGGATVAQAMAAAAPVFRTVAEYARGLDPDLVVCFEPNSRQYGCTFVVSMAEAAAFARLVDHPNLRVNLDTGNAELEGEAVPDAARLAAPLLGHVQVSMPFLKTLRADDVAAAALRARFADVVFSLEMVDTRPADLPRALYAFWGYA